MPSPKKRLKARMGISGAFTDLAKAISSRKGRPMVVPARERRRVRRFILEWGMGNGEWGMGNS